MPDKMELEDQREVLEHLKDSQGWQIYLGMLRVLLAQSRRFLEEAEAVAGLHRSQGEIAAYTRAMTLVNDTIKQLDDAVKTRHEE